MPGPRTSCTTNPLDLAARIKRRARELGFDHVGIAGVDRFAEGDVVVQRIRNGLLAGLDWMTVERASFAADVRNLLPDARSIVAVAMAYPAAAAPPPDDAPCGRVARYAWLPDYHDTLKARLRQLRDHLVALAPGAAGACCVDTARVVDRAIARRAGIGWYGKNTCILSRGSGSWTLLGALITTLDLPPDQPLRTHCGSCARCIAACPTGAIVAPGVLDSRRCISYLTIENRGPIPPALRPAVGTWVFGCDLCQEVCPVNRPANAVPEATEPVVDPYPDLVDLLALDDALFAARFRGTAVKRARREGLARNAAVALGNIGDSRAVPALVRALTDTSPLVRGHAAWALGEIGGDTATAALRAALPREPDPDTRVEIESAMKSSLLSSRA